MVLLSTARTVKKIFGTHHIQTDVDAYDWTSPKAIWILSKNKRDAK
jgi:hypothetical protein